MAKKISKIEVTYLYTIEVDEDAPLVKEYDNEKEMVSDLVHYQFKQVLPVLNNGVSIKEIDVVEWSSNSA